MQPIYSKVEDLCEELVNQRGSGTVNHSDIQALIDQALINRVKAATSEFTDQETLLMLDFLKLETDPSNLPISIDVRKYTRLRNEIMIADNLTTLARSYKTKSLVQISFMMQDQTVYDEELLEEDEPIRATFRFSLDIDNGELYSYVDIDYEIDRETFAHVIDFERLKERLKKSYGAEALVTANSASESRFTINVYLENIFADKDISVVMRFNVDVDSDNYLKFSVNENDLMNEPTEIDMIKSEIEDHIVESIKLYNTEIESGNETMIAKIEEFHSLIKEFNFEANPYRLVIVDDLLKLQVPKMHPHQKDRFFTIAKISEHSYENLIFIVKTQIQAINFYDELLCREDLFDVRFKMSKDRFFTLDAILDDDEYQYGKVRVRLSDADIVEVEYSIYSVVVNSEYVEISGKQSQIFYRVSSNKEDEKLDFQIQTATTQRCHLKDFHRTLETVKSRLKDRSIRITPVTD